MKLPNSHVKWSPLQCPCDYLLQNAACCIQEPTTWPILIKAGFGDLMDLGGGEDSGKVTGIGLIQPQPQRSASWKQMPKEGKPLQKEGLQGHHYLWSSTVLNFFLPMVDGTDLGTHGRGHQEKKISQSLLGLWL